MCHNTNFVENPESSKIKAFQFKSVLHILQIVIKFHKIL